MISIVICTYNRSDLLRDALESFFAQDRLDTISHELLVIDNNSTDDTPHIVQSFSHQPSLRYLYEAEPGLSKARNLGVSEARGELVAFADNDVVFSAGWLDELSRGAERWPDAAVFGGKAVARWDFPKPKWFEDYGRYTMRGMISHFEPDLPEGPMALAPFGCNVAFRTAVLRQYGGFCTRFGRHGERITCCDETEVINRIAADGGTIVYLPDAFLYHRVHGERRHKAYYLGWERSYQMTMCMFRRDECAQPYRSYRHALRANRWVFRQLAERFGEWLWLLVTLRWSRMFSRRLSMVGLWEYLKWELAAAGEGTRIEA